MSLIAYAHSPFRRTFVGHMPEGSLHRVEVCLKKASKRGSAGKKYITEHTPEGSLDISYRRMFKDDSAANRLQGTGEVVGTFAGCFVAFADSHLAVPKP